MRRALVDIVDGKKRVEERQTVLPHTKMEKIL
jgi:hypothetical protein